MKIIPLGIDGAWLASSPIWTDERGSFREWFKAEDVATQTGIHFSVAQSNLSESKIGVVRGIHYSLAVAGQAKLITCLTGLIRDVIVDIRPSSPTYGKHVSVDLFGGDDRGVLIAAGLGHGFVSLMDRSMVAYLTTSPYSPLEEFEINPLDPSLRIEWGLPVGKLLLSAKDAAAPSLAERSEAGKLPK